MFGAKQVTVVDASGRKLASFPWETQYDVNAADPVYFDGKLLITSGYGKGCALLDLAGTGRALWQNTNLRGHFCSPVFVDGFIFGIDGQTGSGQLKCLDPKTGEVKWSQAGRFENMTVAAGKIIALNSGGELIVAEAVSTGYKELAKASVLGGGGQKWTAPVLANGLIYCRGGEGDLVCVDVR
jgi:outer membrane protein assembly factor BamB